MRGVRCDSVQNRGREIDTCAIATLSKPSPETPNRLLEIQIHYGLSQVPEASRSDVDLCERAQYVFVENGFLHIARVVWMQGR